MLGRLTTALTISIILDIYVRNKIHSFIQNLKKLWFKKNSNILSNNKADTLFFWQVLIFLLFLSTITDELNSIFKSQ